jgi:hypothetical protein
MVNNQPMGQGDGEDNLPPPPNLGQLLRNFLEVRMRAGWFKTKFFKLLMQPPKVKVVVAVVAITMVDLKIRAIPLS